MRFFGRIFDSGQRAVPRPPSDFFDIHHGRTLAALRDFEGNPVRDLEHSGRTSEELGAPVRDFFLHNPEVQWRYPLGLLPLGQKRFVKWLLGKGRPQHGFSADQILGFLHETAANLPRYIALTYHINPAWQERFPKLDPEGRELIAWLCAQFPKFTPLRKILPLPLRAIPSGSSTPATIEGVNLLSHFCYPSGIQQAAFAMKAAFEVAGLQTSCRDVPTGVRTELAPRENWLGDEIYPITLTNVAPAPHFESRYRRAGLAPRAGTLQIAYWAWELDTVPNEWKELAQSLHEIWAPTPFVAEAMRASMPVPVYEMLPGLSIGKVQAVPRSRLGIDQDEFVFLFMFDMCSDFRRKNPLALVHAFRGAFTSSERATLVLKISRGSSDPANLARLQDAIQGSKIVLLDELVSRAEAYGYIAMSDAVVSLHRSEGQGLLMAEAMQLGKPVIATNYSGNTAFMTRSNSLLVDYELVSIAEDGAIYKKGNRWAEPSESQAGQYMRQLFEDRMEAAAIGARARADTTRLLSLEAAGARMKARLDEIICSRV